MSNIIRFETFLRIPSFFYRSVGVDLWNTNSGPLQSAVFYISLFNVNVWLLSELIFAVLMFTKNFIQATMTLSYAGFVLVGSIKMYFMWRKKAEMTRFLQLMNTIFPRTESQQKMMNLRSHLRQCTIVMSAFALIFMILIWTYNLYPYMQRQIYDRWLQVRIVNKTLPYESYIPWNWHGHWTFYLYYTLQSIAGYHSASGQIASDLVLCAMATQIIMHYEYVAQRIAEYQPQALRAPRLDGMESETYRKDMKFLCDIIGYHANVLSLSDIMNEVLGVPLLVNFMTSSFVICFVGFQMTMGAEPDYMVKLFLFLFSSLIQIYLICHYGQQLIDASNNVSRAVYNHGWVHSHVHYQRMLVLVTARAQKPAMLKATSFVRISRGTLTDIMQISYKFFTLVRTMYSN
ncbi:odorant receptor 85c-like [Bactrocera neohumeralis]|uniref:odorant receptor 85c-like n=1 Tax=Bactrocera neohumeralis TaxID=98809 RepID=UPI002165D8D0|nr:odorant receptor 85c-like [Bactrocera neohumeralis]